MKDWNINVNVFTDIGNNMDVCKNKNDNFRYYNSDKNIKGF